MSDYDTKIPTELGLHHPQQLALLTALENLPAEQREAVRLRYFIGLPSKEIAKKLGKTEGTTRVLISRALRQLQTMLAE
ncbi:MAG: sigma-70 family RNA polymerase sigma factor [Planctomycetales bacterium]|nr:sigma-70 family RNA polymerase sigma factor [Planctomycetales bacterium]